MTQHDHRHRVCRRGLEARTLRAVAAWLGLTPRRYQSGGVDYDGHTSRRGDSQLRALLYEAASVLLTRVRSESALCCGSGLASNAPLAHWLVKWPWFFVQAHTRRRQLISRNME
jgi:transposase